MPKLWRKTGGSWSEIKSVYRKTGGVWVEVLNIYRKTSGVWTNVFSGAKIPGNSVKPTISGSGYLYSTITNNSVGTWTNNPTSYARQWMRASNVNGSPGTYSNITGATGTTYVTTASDDDKFIAIKITATNAVGSNSVASDPIYINKYTPVSLTKPTFSTAIATPNTTITAVAEGTTYWKNTTVNTGDTIPDSYTYLWTYYPDGTNPVNTNNTSSYTPAIGDVGKQLQVTVTAKNTGGSTSVTSNPTSTVSSAPVVDVYPTISSTTGYKTKYSSNLYTGTSTDGTAYSLPAFRGNTGSWTPNPTSVNWYFQYSANGSTGWTSFYDFDAISLSGTDTSENQNHDWYVDNFYTSTGGAGGATGTNSVGYYVRFASEGYSNSTPAGINYTSAFGPIYDSPSAPGSPTLTWSSSYDANNSYITAYWSASSTKFTYYLQYNNGTSWITLGSGTTTTPTSTTQFGPVLAPHGSKSYRVINVNSDNVFAKSSSVTFDATKAPGNLSSVNLYNFSTGNSNLFLTTGTDTTAVKYTYTNSSNSTHTIGEFSQNTSSSYPYHFQDNLLAYLTSKTWNNDTYSPGTTYYLNNTVWYAGNQYMLTTTIRNPGPPYQEYGVVGQVPTNTTYWTKIQTITYNPGDYVSYAGSYYFCKIQTSGTYPTNTSYWSANYLSFNLTATPYNGTKAGTSYAHPSTIFIRANGASDPLTISVGPTFSSVTSSSFTATYTPSVYTNRVIIDIKKGSPLASITGYPYTKTVSGATEYTESPTGLSSNTDHTIYLTPRYLYNSTYNVYADGTQSSGTQKTSAPAPNAFTYTLSKGGSVTTPSTPTISRVSSTSNIVLFELGSSFATDTYNYGVNQSGAAFGTRTGTPAQFVNTLNQWDSNGNSSASGTYDTISTIESGSNNSEMTISTTAYGKTRAAVVNVNTTTGASSWAINFSWSGAEANSVTYFSNGTGTASASTAATQTVYTTSFPVTVATITGANDPTITINNVTAYSGTSQTGTTTAGTAGTTTSLVVGRPTSTSSTATQYYTYYTAPTLYTVTFNTNGASGSPSSSSVTQSTSGGSVTLATKGTMSSTGNIFGGWRTGTSSGTIYGFGDTYTPTANITLYAYYAATPTCSAPTLNFRRWPSDTSANWEYFCDYPTPSGGYKAIQSMEYDIRNTNSTTSTTNIITYGQGTISYPDPTVDLYPYLSQRDTTWWSFRVASGSVVTADSNYAAGRTRATGSPRYARVRVKMTGIDGLTYNGTWTSPLL